MPAPSPRSPRGPRPDTGSPTTRAPGGVLIAIVVGWVLAILAAIAVAGCGP